MMMKSKPLFQLCPLLGHAQSASFRESNSDRNQGTARLVFQHGGRIFASDLHKIRNDKNVIPDLKKKPHTFLFSRVLHLSKWLTF